MRINADKPRGNSDYYFQHITTREENRRKEAGEERKDKESKNTKRATRSTQPPPRWGSWKYAIPKKSESGDGCCTSRCFFQMQLQQSSQSFARLAGGFSVWICRILQNIALTWTDLQRLHKNGIMIWAAAVLCTEVYEAFCAALKTRRFLLLQPGSEFSSWHRWWFLLSPHLTSVLKTDQQYNLITAALQRETSVNTSPFYLLIHLDK